MKTAIVVGANSMLGRRIVGRLGSAGVAVVAAGRCGATEIGLDLQRGWTGAGISPSVRADVIFHCAASFCGDDFEGARTNFEVNALGCHWVLELADRTQCGQIVTSGSIFSKEGVDSAGMNSYGLSKAHGEEILAWGMRRAGGRLAALRLPQLYDTAGECVRHQPWFGRIIAYASRGLDLRMPASAGTRNFLHVEDAAAMMVAAARLGIEGSVDIAHPQSMRHEEIAALAYEVFGKGGEARIAPEKTPFRGISLSGGGDAHVRLGLPPPMPMREGIARIRDAGTAGEFGPLDVS